VPDQWPALGAAGHGGKSARRDPGWGPGFSTAGRTKLRVGAPRCSVCGAPTFFFCLLDRL